MITNPRLYRVWAPPRYTTEDLSRDPSAPIKFPFPGCEPIVVPDWKELVVAKGSEESYMRLVGKYMDDIFLANPTSTRIFPPFGELEGNSLPWYSRTQAGSYSGTSTCSVRVDELSSL